MTCRRCGQRPATVTIACYRDGVRTTIPDPVCGPCWQRLQNNWAAGNGPYSLRVVTTIPEPIVA
jgi:hypothetical protein